MNGSTNGRIGWQDLPAGVQRGVERIIGDEVVEWHSQSGGFSPGTADRVVTQGGRRAFVKACGTDRNPDTPTIHRREIAVMGVLPADVPAPRMLGSYDDDDWVAIVLEDVVGASPRTPCDADELWDVLDAVEQLSGVEVNDPDHVLPYASVDLAGTFRGWRNLLEDDVTPPEGWTPSRIAWLDRLATGALPELDGDGLVHTDLRSDNILITRDGGIVLVDWPWANRGQSWFDGVGLLGDVLVGKPSFDADALIIDHPLFDGVDRDVIDGVIAGLTGYFVDAARRPAPAGLPTIREAQRRQGDAMLAWLERRLDPRR
ncbi:phosphotransferase [Plantibacter sp. YIM 135347]|uniref:phosphotransferase n=1 Tax=Plantibacter sp. YIM 135347 TaxID=3423919 RepID=UPI003D336551